MKSNEFTLYTGGEPCIPGKNRKYSKEGGKKAKEYIDGIKSEGKEITMQEYRFQMEHIFYEDQINLNIEIENYEECARLLKIKNSLIMEEGETPLFFG